MSNTPEFGGGLNAAQVAESRARHGRNVFTPPPRPPWWKLYLEKFNDPVIRILLVAAGLAIVSGIYEGNYVEGAGILCAVLLSTSLAFFNEFKAARDFEELSQVSDDQIVRVLRDGEKAGIPRRDVVVGEIVFVETGVEVPADGALLRAVDLFIDESRLTGESLPVEKSVSPPEPKAAVSSDGDDDHAYACDVVMRGTIVSRGNGVLRITAVGDSTEAGRNASAAVEHADKQTPLVKQLEHLAKLIGVFGFGAAALLLGALLGRAWLNGELNLDAAQWRIVALAAVSLVVALAPVWMTVLENAWEVFRGASEKKEAHGAGWRSLFALVGGALIFFGGERIMSSLNLLPPGGAPWLPRAMLHRFIEMFMIAVTVIVVAVPEGLAMSVTLCIAYTMRRMMATNTLVRRMFACETIGAANVICSDKTGTLTLNQMRVQETLFSTLNTAAGKELVHAALAINGTADLAPKEKSERVLGNATEGALLLWLEAQGADYAALRAKSKTLKQLPFSTEHKLMCTLTAPGADGVCMLHVKGAPEFIFERCGDRLEESGVQPLGNLKSELAATLHGFQERAMRTLAFAYRRVPVAESEKPLQELARGLTWLGAVGIIDPLRAEVPGAIAACQKAGIGVKIVTGDTARTANEIARQIGLLPPGEPAAGYVLTGAEFMALDDAHAREASKNLRVMARARPADKLRLVKLLKAQGEVVAVTGDGANDAPALNHANVGLSMGRSGTASAREASDIVLLDDSFTSIVNAVQWGRSLYRNIQSFIVFQLTINVAALGLALAGPFTGVTLPLTVMQMLWINLIMDTFAALALSAEPPHASVMNAPPRKADAAIITPEMTWNILITGVAFLALMIGLLLRYKADGELTRHELTLIFTVMVLLQFWNLFNARCYGLGGSALRGIFGNREFFGVAGMILVGQFLVVQFGGALFRTEPLTVVEWLWIVGGTSGVLWIGEVKRLVFRNAPVAR